MVVTSPVFSVTEPGAMVKILLKVGKDLDVLLDTLKYDMFLLTTFTSSAHFSSSNAIHVPWADFALRGRRAPFCSLLGAEQLRAIVVLGGLNRT